MRNALFALCLAAASGAASASSMGVSEASAVSAHSAAAQSAATHSAAAQSAAAPATGGLGDGWSAVTKEDAPEPELAGRARKSAALLQQLVALLEPSTSPRDQALRAKLMQLPSADPGQAAQAALGGVILRRAAAAGATDRLVQWLWATASDADAGCTTASACPERDGSLARIEPDNAAAWLPIFDRAWADDDSAGTDTALARMAEAIRFDDFFVEVSGAWVGVMGRFPEISAAQYVQGSASMRVDDAEVASIITGIAIGAGTGMLPSLLSLAHACDRGKEPLAGSLRFERCTKIGRTMAHQGTSLSAQMIGLALVRRTGQWSVQDAAMERELRWRQHNGIPAIPSEKDAAGLKRYFSDLQATGNESLAINRAMARKGIALTPPAGWDPSATAGND